jgi:large subunit ribosomal protein L18
MSNTKTAQRTRRQKRIRAVVKGTALRPRLAVFKSNKALYAQVIDDQKGLTLAAAKGKNAGEVGAALAKAAAGKGVTKVVFDRGGYIYTGSVKAIAEAARENGLQF